MSQIRSPFVRLRSPDARGGGRPAAAPPSRPGASAAGPPGGIRGALRTRPAIVSLSLGVAGLAMFTLLLLEAVLNDRAAWPAWIGYAALVVPQIALAAIAIGVTPLVPPGARRDRTALAGSLLGLVTFIGIAVVGIVMLVGPLGSYLP